MFSELYNMKIKADRDAMQARSCELEQKLPLVIVPDPLVPEDCMAIVDGKVHMPPVMQQQLAVFTTKRVIASN